jgi:hypothetical protein
MYAANSAARQTCCPRCGAQAGSLCKNAQGQPLMGVHYGRTATSRRAIRAALQYYAGMNLRTKEPGETRHCDHWADARTYADGNRRCAKCGKSVKAVNRRLVLAATEGMSL